MLEELIRVYGATWCPDTSRARRILDKNHIRFAWYDVDLDRSARAYVESVNQGYCRIPTIVFIDGSILVEPDDAELKSKLLESSGS
jgi:glutaredoxin